MDIFIINAIKEFNILYIQSILTMRNLGLKNRIIIYQHIYNLNYFIYFVCLVFEISTFEKINKSISKISLIKKNTYIYNIFNM